MVKLISFVAYLQLICISYQILFLLVFLFASNMITTEGHKLKEKLNKRKIKQGLSMGWYILPIPTDTH